MILDTPDVRLSMLEEQLARITVTLGAFYQSPLSVSSLQPVLALCVELNPQLRVRPSATAPSPSLVPADSKADARPTRAASHLGATEAV
jgi:hypothetical protein